jgi:hypothetical protein
LLDFGKVHKSKLYYSSLLVLCRLRIFQLHQYMELQGDICRQVYHGQIYIRLGNREKWHLIANVFERLH